MLINLKYVEQLMKVKSGIKAGRHGLESVKRRPRPAGKGGV